MDKDHAKTIPISEILDKLNYKPHRCNQTKALYQSPLQADKPLSFWVYFKTNRWHDYKLVTGGDLMDLAGHYLKFTRENHTSVDALRWITNLSSNRLIRAVAMPTELIPRPEAIPLELRSHQPIAYIGLIHYLEKQGIPLTLAHAYLREIKVRNLKTGRPFLALGFKNEQGGYELKNPFFEGYVGDEPDISFIRGKSSTPNDVHLFVNYWDFLSVLSQLSQRQLKGDAIVLHSLALLPKATAYLQGYGYRTLYSWMDNNPMGDQATQALTEFSRTQDRLRHVPMSAVYIAHQSMRDYHRSTLASAR